MSDFGLFDIQSHDDLKNLVSFCKQQGIKKVIYSPLKITNPRVGKLPPLMLQLRRVYEHLSHDRPLDFRGGSWRLPHDIAQMLLFATLLQLCQEADIVAKGCKENLIGAPWVYTDQPLANFTRFDTINGRFDTKRHHSKLLTRQVVTSHPQFNVRKRNSQRTDRIHPLPRRHQTAPTHHRKRDEEQFSDLRHERHRQPCHSTPLSSFLSFS